MLICLIKVTDTLKLTKLSPEEKRPSPNALVLPKYTHWNLIALGRGEWSVMEAAVKNKILLHRKEAWGLDFSSKYGGGITGDHI